MVYNGTVKDYKKICNCCAVYIVLFVIAFLIIIGVSSAFIYFHWYLKKDNIRVNLIPILNNNLLDI